MRADAARNRTTVLAAAGRLFDEATDPEQVSMDAVAAAAGVGKGTLFRGFGDRTGLIRAVFEERGRRLRESFAPDRGTPAERAGALMHAVLRFKMDNRVLALALENAGGGSPYATDSYLRWHALLTGLVAEARGPRDAEFLAHALLAAVRSDLVAHLRDEPEDRMHAGLDALLTAVFG